MAEETKPADDKRKLIEALVKFQASMPTVLKDTENPFFRSKYADLSAIWKACRTLLTECGLAVVQLTHPNPDGMELETVLLHTSGQSISSRGVIPMAKRDPQGFGSAMTYLRRYQMSAILGIVSDVDDDGNYGTRDNDQGSPNQYDQRPQNNAPPRQPDTPPAPTTQINYLGVGTEAAKKEAKLKELCTRLNKAGDKYVGADAMSFVWNSQVLNDYCLAEFDSPLAKLDKTEMAVLITDLDERATEREAISGDGDGSAPAPDASATTAGKLKPEQLNVLVKLADIKNLSEENVAKDFSGGVAVRFSELSEDQAAKAILGIQKT